MAATFNVTEHRQSMRFKICPPRGAQLQGAPTLKSTETCARVGSYSTTRHWAVQKFRPLAKATASARSAEVFAGLWHLRIRASGLAISPAGLDSDPRSRMRAGPSAACSVGRSGNDDSPRQVIPGGSPQSHSIKAALSPAEYACSRAILILRL